MTKRTGYTDEVLDLEAINQGLRAKLAAANAVVAEVRAWTIRTTDCDAGDIVHEILEASK